MTLEDFFTLTEMKNGFVSLARVEELISIMKQQKDCVVSNISDTARQWSSVASTLAATENKDCLSHFVKLNGLCYLNQWLQEAIKCNNGCAEIAVEELLNSLLGSLERLPVHTKDSVASGIQITVEKLVGSNSLNIKEKARALSERWKHAVENDVSYQDINKDEKCEDENPKCPSDTGTIDAVNSRPPVFENPTSREGLEENSCKEDSAGTGNHSHNSNVAGSAEASQQDNTAGVQTSKENQTTATLNSVVTNSNLKDMDVLPSVLVPNSCQESMSGTEGSSICPAAEIASGTTSCSNVSGDIADDHCDASEFKDDSVKDTEMEVDTDGGSPSKSDQMESCKANPSSCLSVSSHAHKSGRSVSCSFDATEIKSKTLENTEALPRSASIDCDVPKYLRNMELKSDMQGLLSNRPKLRVNDDPETSPGRTEEALSVREVKRFGSDSKLEVSRVATVGPQDSSKPADKKSITGMDDTSELGLEYGEIDALEVARQVAIEVEREVVDYREPFCSSSPDGNSEEDTRPQFSVGQQDQPVNEEKNGRGSPPGEDLDDVSSPKADNQRIAEADVGPDKCEEDVEVSEQITHKTVDKTEQNRCVFDLNEDLSEDVCVEESDRLHNSTPNNSINATTPIVVSASKGAPVLPVSPLRFEGELGWKGSAATSAFRPASPRRTPDVEKTSSGHKRKANLIEIDLNVAESGDDVVDPFLIKPTLVSSGILSREDSVEVSSRREDRFKLDLNRHSDEDVSLFPSSYWSLPHQNGDRTMSPASSSSSRQPTTRDFDLNDNPNFFDAMGSRNLSRFSSKNPAMRSSSKPDNPGITIMGSKITETKNYLDETPLSLMGNGPSVDATATALRPMMPYSHIPHPAYGYNGGPVMGPPMPFPSPFYAPGSIPYMVDSRGATVVPQILTTPGLNSAASAMPPFLMSVPNTSPGLNGAGSSKSGLDLNSGFMPLETGSRESGNFKNFFMQGHNGLMEDQARDGSQFAGAPVNLKESDPGWEPFTLGYKHVTSWQ
ncbi:uncharacterized protein A4U43_C04F21430 [Asparagus officinalis]|uniref:TFIIS N-terminal domain-containing protein n=1 Tax=Asparagus officinalis TaxID=4686 RepID=A0A5P1F4H6_ASPOF|nr:uncharacterized protein LOC109837716 [Asparagus officinalis]XP_020261646.1 uncharacterized protein LOC109837716 [Asparagus officinalis]ONK72633.1 uncharacterized protein A4U43_C04F21430 [Asparagus officinalis]